MFFIGIFGIQSGHKPLHEASGICPRCEALDRYRVEETYTYFHFFFIPLWKWNRRYFVYTRCCRGVMELDPEVGERLKRGETVTLHREDIIGETAHVDPQCQHCGAPLELDYRFCPHCGQPR